MSCGAGSSRYAGPARQLRSINQLNQPCVRDLAWCLTSPAIYRLGDRQQPASLFNSSRQLWYWLSKLDHQPEPLYQAIAGQRSHRIGIYFETLLHFALRHYLQPERLYYALPVRQQGHTLGEYDFLLRRRTDAALWHIEVCIKFYLGLPGPQGSTDWVGLNRHDRLLSKRDKMLYQQLQLSRHPCARQQLRQMGEQVGAKSAMMHGRLFYPFDKPEIRPPKCVQQRHLRGWWIRQSRQQHLLQRGNHSGQRLDETMLVRLTKRQWLAPLAPDDAQFAAQQAAEQRSQKQWPPSSDQAEMVARLINTPLGWREHDRGVLVPDRWFLSQASH